MSDGFTVVTLLLLLVLLLWVVRRCIRAAWYLDACGSTRAWGRGQSILGDLGVHKLPQGVLLVPAARFFFVRKCCRCRKREGLKTYVTVYVEVFVSAIKIVCRCCAE